MQKRTFCQALGALIFGGFIMTRQSVAATTNTSSAKPRLAVVYFSKSGNTESVAKAVQAMTGADIFEVKTVKPYPEAYKPTTEIVKEELEKNITREVHPIDIDLSKYDVVVLATPTWWHHTAMPLQTWARAQNFSGKLVITCNSHGGGGLMHTREDFEKILKPTGARLGTHLTVEGSVHTNSKEVRNWLIANGVLAK